MSTLGVWIDAAGAVTEVVKNTFLLERSLERGSPLRGAFDPLSRAKLDQFLRAVDAEGAVLDWELNLLTPGGVACVTAACVRGENGRVLVLISDGPTNTESILAELTRVNSEQTNALRAAHKALGRGLQPAAPPPAPSLSEDGALTEYASLANESANMQRELARQKVELERLNKLKNEILGMAAHDLRNPLMTITGFADLLRVGACGPVTSTQQEYLDSIMRGAGFMAQLIEDLLQHAQVSTATLKLNPTSTDLGALLQEVVGTYRVQAQAKQIDLRLTIEPELPSLRVDRHKIEQVLANLISNALKFSLPKTEVDVRGRPHAGGAWFEVQDRGPGISDADRRRLFEPFVRASAQPTGGEVSTGLGLAIAKSIVKGHGGRLRVESEIGVGSTFTVLLPPDPPLETEDE